MTMELSQNNNSKNRAGRRGRRHARSNAPSHVLSTNGTPPGTFAVIDPLSKKLFIPLVHMHETRAVHRMGVPSLCRIFLEGRCRQGASCYQAHADIGAVQHLRAAALALPSCCCAHGAPSDIRGLPVDLELMFVDDTGSTVGRVPLSRVVVTNGLRALVTAQGAGLGVMGMTPFDIHPKVVVVPLTSLCRLHSGHGEGPCCRFDEECNFVHACRETVRNLASTASSAAATTAATAATAANAVSVSSANAVGSELLATRAKSMSASRSARIPRMSTTPAEMLSASADVAATPIIRFDPLALATTAPTRPGSALPMGVSPVTNRSFSSTPTNVLLWRHNPYGSSRTSSAVET